MAEILPNSVNDVASRGVTNETLAQFKGLARQVVINVDDNFRPVIMDGLTLGGKTKVVIEKDLEEYAKKQDAATKTELTNYLPKNNPTFTGTLSGTNGTFTGTLSLNGDSVATQSDVNTLETNVVKTTEQTLTEEQQTQSLENQGVIQAITELIQENGGTVPTSLSENSVQTMSVEGNSDPWADLE